jgi:hypothetical protein
MKVRSFALGRCINLYNVPLAGNQQRYPVKLLQAARGRPPGTPGPPGPGRARVPGRIRQGPGDGPGASLSGRHGDRATVTAGGRDWQSD